MSTLIAKAAGHFPDAGPDFNHAAAEAVFETIMKMDDDEALITARMLHGAALEHDMVIHGDVIAKAASQAVRRNLELVGKMLVRSAVAKAAAGGLPVGEIDALDLLSKAAETSEERADAARKQHRDLLTGRFVQEHKSISHDGGKPLAAKQAALLGIPEPEGFSLSSEQRAGFQRAYHQVASMIANYGHLPAGSGILHLNYSDGSSGVATVKTGDGGTPQVPVARIDRSGATKRTTQGINPEKKVTSASFSVLPDLGTPAGAYHAAFGAAGLPGVGRTSYDVLGEGGLGNAATWDRDNPGSFGDQVGSAPGDEFTPSRAVFRRLAAGSRALEASLGNAAPPKLKIALQAGQHIGELGPEAQKVIGPTADKAAYRYRGIERATPDTRLTNAITSIQRAAGLNRDEKREFLVHGSTDADANWRPSGPLAYLRSRLPKAELNTLQTKSGTIPPSEGFILDKNGKLVSQSVGFADDHYLPFNLKKLTKLKGGEYLRTRTWGGPTTEDIYTGLMSGAKSLSVVSHNGSYTLEFDDALTGGRRFNDKAHRMVARYGQLLDAVKSEQVTTGGIHPSRIAELEAIAARTHNPDWDEAAYSTELTRLKKAELKRPVMSAQQRGEAAADFFARAGADTRTADGHIMTGPEFVNDALNRRFANALAAAPADRRDEARLMLFDRAGANDSDPVAGAEKAATTLGQRKQFDAHMKRAEDDYKASLTPLSLNGQGYESALNALQEQFPYYIKRTEFHPWTDALNGHDTGYVLPRHNRPAAALAGYFDPNVTGRGKVRADLTRFQNYAVHRGSLKPLDVSTDEGRARLRTDGTEQRATGVVSGPVDEKVATALQESADRAMYNEIRTVQQLSAQAPGGARALDAGVLDQLEAANFAPAFLRMRRMTEPEFVTAYRNDAQGTRKLLRDAVDEARTRNLVGLDRQTVRNFEAKGLPVEPRKVGNDPASALLDSDGTPYDFSDRGQVYSESYTPTATELHDTYKTDPDIQDLVRAGDLPADLGDEMAMDTMAAKLRGTLIGNRQALQTWSARRAAGSAVGAPPVDEPSLQRRAAGYLRARELQRRLREFRQAPITPSQLGLGDTNSIHFHAPPGMSPQEMMEAARQMQAAEDAETAKNTRTIDA